MLVRLLSVATAVRIVPVACALLLCLLTAGCLSTPERSAAGPDPSDPKARVPATAYRPVLGGYVSQRPVEPAPWREQNDRVAPARKE